MTTVTVPATTLTFDDDGFLSKSEFMGFTVEQLSWNQPDSYIAYKEELQFADKTLSGMLESIIEHCYETQTLKDSKTPKLF